VLFNKNQSTLVAFPPGVAGSYTVPGGVTTIASYAFESCPRLASITLPSSLTAIGDYAFYNCTGLAGLTLPDGVLTIGNYAFYRCTALATLTLLGGVTSVGNYAFYGCTNLSDLTFSSTVENLGSYAFYGCSALSHFTIPDSVTLLGNYVFANCTNLTGVFFEGDAPSLGGTYVFRYDTNAILYYLPDMAGWSATFAGRPAKLWNPVIQASGPSFGVRSNSFGFQITGTTNIPIVVAASVGLGGASWTPVLACSITNGSIYFRDTSWTNYSGRYYRVQQPY
jgi:hypothetical protein